jgi:hypothetical protein
LAKVRIFEVRSDNHHTLKPIAVKIVINIKEEKLEINHGCIIKSMGFPLSYSRISPSFVTPGLAVK